MMPGMLRIRELRESAGLTQEGLAYLSGLSYTTIARAEGSDTANTESLRKIAKALGVSVRDLFAEASA
jgi:transcriptional regulator with XRE-family HTH domain